jgi:DDE superfamily endonuclease
MPRLSKRARYIKYLQRVIQSRVLHHQYLHDHPSPANQRLLEVCKLADTILLHHYQHVLSKRYLFRSSTYRISSPVFNSPDRKVLVDHESHWADIASPAPPVVWHNEEDFLRLFRVSPKFFEFLVQSVKAHPIWVSAYDRGRKPYKLESQLLVLLNYLGTEGSGASGSAQRQAFRIGKGTSRFYHNRAEVAILSLRNQYYAWPDAEEREKISEYIHHKYHWPNCVGFVDGTLFPLGTMPQTKDRADYFGRKQTYALSTMIVCDHNRKIRSYLAGWPGCTHDNRIFKNMKIARQPEHHFSHKEYILGDSAFENNWFMVSSYKAPAGHALSEENEHFNTMLSKARITVEQCIGILKGRFPWLRNIRKRLTDDPESIKSILRTIEVCVILHNMLIDFGEGTVPRDWNKPDDTGDTIDDPPIVLQPEDVLEQPIHEGAPKDLRRQQLTAYWEEAPYIV